MKMKKENNERIQKMKKVINKNTKIKICKK